MSPDDALAAVRACCLALPKAMEKVSHGSPCFFIERGRQFCAFLHNHHGDGRLAVWLAAPPGVQEVLVQSQPEVYFRPPYVGPSGWVGVCLDKGLDWSVIEDHIAEAHKYAARK